ncbi:hypothetical protein ACNKF0_17870 [Nocardioides sp. T5]|uniref:hypothetical protein n=1 Tax=Nocardioides sp. T5 TaxID=3400182 RepID=UPI003A872817
MWLGDVRIHARADTSTPLFVGVAATSDVDGYLGDVSRDTLRDFRVGRAVLRTTDGGAPATPPSDQTFWVAQAIGTDATLTWDLEDGDWTIVLMRADGTTGVSADVSTGAEPAHPRRRGRGPLRPRRPVPAGRRPAHRHPGRSATRRQQ